MPKRPILHRLYALCTLLGSLAATAGEPDPRATALIAGFFAW